MRMSHRWVVIASLVVLLSGALASLLRANQGDISWAGKGAGGGGSFMGVAIDPSNPNNALMGSDTGGIYRTTDGGLTWSNSNTGGPANPAGDAGWYDVETFAYDPND